MQSETFHIDREIELWRKALLKYRHIDPEYADELAAGLRDRYDALVLNGLTPETAFKQAKTKTMSSPEELSQEYGKVVTRPSKSNSGSFSYLLPNYLKTGWRNLTRKSFYNVVNFLSLTVGLICSVIALLYIDYETSFDDFVPDADRVYRVGQRLRSQDYSMVGFVNFFNTEGEDQLIQIDGLRKTQGVTDVCQFFIFDQRTYTRANDKRLVSEEILQTNTPDSFFEMFGWKIVAGSVTAFAKDLNTATLTQSEAERFFGKDLNFSNVIGQSLTIEDQTYTITTIIDDVPANAHFDFSMALHIKKIDYWGARTYVKTEKGVDKDVLIPRFRESVKNFNIRLYENELFGGLLLDPIQSIHLKSEKLYEMKPPGDARYIYIIGIIAAIILLLTVSNYTNLSIAMNAGRMREIGMRKVFGASKSQVSRQFLIETLLLSLLCIPVVILLLWVIIPSFNNFMGVKLPADFWADGNFWLLLLTATLFAGLLAGLYPSIYLGSRNILNLFNGNMAASAKRGFSARKAIITFQFVLLIGLCSLTLFVNSQLQFIQNKDLGFDKEGVLYVLLGDDWETYGALRNELMQMEGVTNVGTGSPLGRTPFNQTTYRLEGTEPVFDDAYNLYLDYNMVALLGIETTVPELISNPDQVPNNLVLINQTAADKLSKVFDIPKEDLLGRTIIEEPEYVNEETGEVGFPIQIGGFYEDMNVFSLRETITPMFITVYKEERNVNWVAVAFNQGTEDILAKAKTAYDALKPDQAFVHDFLSQRVRELYEREQRIGKLCIYFSAVAFIVALIGLIALTAYLTVLRKKEIGMRKVLGASTATIIKKFNGEYVPLLAIAILIAGPLTYYGVSRWLSTFAYRIDINLWVFLLAAVFTFIVSSIAVSLVTLRVVRGEPVHALQENQ